MPKNSVSQQSCKLFIGGLNSKSSKESLRSYFEQWGEITHCVVMTDPQSKQSRGFGFITYKCAHMVDDAQAARPHKIDGQKLTTKRAVPLQAYHKPAASVTVNKLYVSGINGDLGEGDLRKYFGPYGNIVSINVVTDTITGEKRGFAFVEFDDYDPVDKIVLQHHNYKGRLLEVKKALSREERDNINMKKEMGCFGRRRGVGSREVCRTPDEINRGGYGNSGYGGGSGGGWNYRNGDSYPSVGRSGSCGNNVGSSYGRETIGDNTGYAQSNQGGGSYAVGLGDNGYAGGCGNGGGGWNYSYVDNYSSGGRSSIWGGIFGSSYGRGTIRDNTGYAQSNQGGGNYVWGLGSGGYGQG